MPFNMGSTQHEVSPKAHSATATRVRSNGRAAELARRPARTPRAKRAAHRLPMRAWDRQCDVPLKSMMKSSYDVLFLM